MTKSVKNYIKKICKIYKVKVGFIDLGEFGGLAQGWNNQIYIASDLDNFWSINAMFHELQHILNYRNRKYWNYHKASATRKELNRLCMRAEIYTDREAKKLAYKWGFKKFKITYSNNAWTRKVMQEYYKR